MVSLEKRFVHTERVRDSMASLRMMSDTQVRQINLREIPIDYFSSGKVLVKLFPKIFYKGAVELDFIDKLYRLNHFACSKKRVNRKVFGFLEELAERYRNRTMDEGLYNLIMQQKPRKLYSTILSYFKKD